MSRPLPVRPPPAAASTVGTLDEAELCGRLADFHGPQGRIVLSIALRQYMESLVITPTEVIHHAKLFKALLEQGQMVETAASKVATIQARIPGQDPRSRRLAIQTAIDESWAKARAAQVAFASFAKGRPPVDAVLAAPAGKSPTGDRAFDLRVALSLELADAKSWSAKLDKLLDIYQWDKDVELSDAADGAIGDLLVCNAATQELIGGNPLPGLVLTSLCELLFGRVAMEAMGPNRLGTLNALFRQGMLPQARGMALDRIRRQLRSPQPLGRGAMDQEAEYLKALTGFLLTQAGLTGGPSMADALTVRYSRRLEQGGASAYRRSIVGLSEGQPDLACRLHYLTAVAAAPAAERHMDEIVDALNAALANELLVENMVLQTPDIAIVERSLAGAVAGLRASNLPTEAKVSISGRAEIVVDEYARKGRLVARLRQVEPVLRRRTIRLAEIACSALIREDGALPLMRQHILEIVRQPQFQADLASQQGNEMAQAEVRRLFELLDRLRQMPSGRASAAAPAAPAARTPQPPLPQGAVTVTVPAAPAMAGGVATVAVPRGPARGAEVTVAAPGAAVTVATTVAAPAGVSAAGPASTGAPGLCPNCFASKVGTDSCRECGYPAQSDNRNGVHLKPGTVLQGRFRAGRVLGQGGFGATYLGWDERLHVKVAIKEYYPASLIAREPNGTGIVPFSDEHGRSFSSGLAKFLDEARMLARLRDIKEIVGVQDFFEQNGTAYLVMELLEGRTMKRFIADSGGRLDARKILTILTPIAKALQSIHEQGLIHRDISPDNIFLTNAGERKLLDFGAARQANSGQDGGLTVILKPGYAPPEQYSQEGKQGPWSDVYALCATIYQALSGKAPPDATSRFMNDKIPRLTEAGVQVPPAFEKALISGLAMRWQERPQSMKDLLRVLTAALG